MKAFVANGETTKKVIDSSARRGLLQERINPSLKIAPKIFTPKNIQTITFVPVKCISPPFNPLVHR